MEEQIRALIANILKVKPEQIENDSAIGDIDSWDSLNHLKIISEIEKQFSIQFTPDVLMDLEDFSDIVKAVEERTK